MGSWGVDRKADKMPTLRVQATSQSLSNEELVQRAMMADLGMDRINELPLDDTPKGRVIPPRARRAPVNVENTEALNGYRALAETGMDDAEAMAARQLPTLGGLNVNRPTLGAGPARNLSENRRSNTANLQGMQTSQNGILMPPGSQLYRFHLKVVGEPGAKTTGNNITPDAPSTAKPATAGSSTARVEPTAGASKPLPPHLRTKSNQSLPVVAPSTAIKAPTPASDNTSSVKGKEKKPSEDTTKQPQLTDKKSSDSYWTGRCKAQVQGKDHDVLIEMKTITSDEHPSGHAICVVACPGVFNETHSMTDYTLDFHKNHLCIVSFGASGLGFPTRYSLKFDDSETAADFVQRADMLQRVISYLREMAASQDEVDMGTVAPVEPADPKAAPPTKAIVKVTEAVRMKKDHSEEDLTDAFSNLKLTNVKDSPMYTTDRPPRVQYSSEQLFERRSSAEAPAGIKDVKIPLEKDSRNGVRLPPHLQQPRASQSIRDTQKAINWMSRTRQTQTSTDSVSKFSMPGLSEAISHHKTVAITAQSPAKSARAQMPSKESTEIRLEKNTDSKEENKTDSGVKLEAIEAPQTKIDIDFDSQMQVVSSIPKASIDSIQAPGDDAARGVAPDETIIESTNPVVTGAATEIEHAHVQNASQDVLPKEPPIPSKTAESDNRDAMSNASNDSAVEFEAPVKAEPDVTTPAPAPVNIPETAPAAQPNPTGYSTPSGIPVPQMVPGQMAPGQVHHVTQMQPLMHPQAMMPGMFPTGVVHAVTVTYHISYPNPGESMGMNSPVHQAGGAFSPNAEPFQPNIHGQVPRHGSDQPRTRRGLGGSMFATGYSAAKFPGSFTGATAE
ncbi:hypothetical protein SGCOL_010851 [Colletotrichum sp. CLE4]